MRDALIIFVAIIASMAIGGYLYLNGGPTFHPTSIIPPVAGSFSVLAEGQNAGGVDGRTNYRIETQDEYSALWNLVYGTSGPEMPLVDFSKDEVIGVFDGSHSSGGYKIDVTQVADVDGMRTIRIRHTTPGDHCSVSESITSPFQLVRAKKTTLSITKQEETVTSACP